MELLLISVYTALCIAIFTVLRIPLNRWTVPTASIGGVVLSFALIQMLNYYHPHSGMSRQHLAAEPITASVTEQFANAPQTTGEHNLVAWFHQKSLLSLNHGNSAEITFASIPGKVFSGKLSMVMPTSADELAEGEQSRIPVLISITDPRYTNYFAQLPGHSHAQTAIYGEQFQQLVVVRKTLLRMSAWMNYLSLFS
jgi:energy-coupling factor transporter transmembrane protein EcfT